SDLCILRIPGLNSHLYACRDNSDLRVVEPLTSFVALVVTLTSHFLKPVYSLCQQVFNALHLLSFGKPSLPMTSCASLISSSRFLVHFSQGSSSMMTDFPPVNP